MRVEVRLLGRFEVVVDGRLIDGTGLSRRDPAQLVKLLALAPTHRLHREQIIDRLWPDAPFASVANRLHKAAHFVRKATEASESVVVSGETVALFPGADLETDVEMFDRLAAEALSTGDTHVLDRALNVYCGELLPFDPYEDWAFHHRQRLQLRYRELLRVAGRFDQLVALDPTDEDGHVGVMRNLLRSGDRTGVLQQFDVLAKVLEEELESDQPGFRQVYDARFLPDGPIESWRAFDELQRRSTSPRNAHRLWRAFGSLDCAEDARRLDVPTLILHSTDDQVWAFREAEELHAMVPGSRLVRLPSINHILQANEPAFATFIDEVERFVSS